MGVKKDRSRFSLRFNEGDPVQKAAIDLLEFQPPHSKAQYVANAVIYYNTHFSDDPQPLRVPAMDKAFVEAVVLEILRQEGYQAEQGQADQEPDAGSEEYVISPVPEQPDADEEAAAPEIDAVTRNLIADTLASFRGHN